MNRKKVHHGNIPSSFKYRNRKLSMNPQKLPSKKRKKMKQKTCGIFIRFHKSRKTLSAGSLSPSGMRQTVMALMTRKPVVKDSCKNNPLP